MGSCGDPVGRTVFSYRTSYPELGLLKLPDQSRTAAVEVLSQENYLIMTRENMMQILSDMGKDASSMEGSCEVEIGRNVGA